MSDRDHLSIGEVLALLAEDFPDVTVSKIRFLESRGLIAPERTPSGYRKFYEADVERLRWILTQQKVHFLPLRVIRERLDQEAFDFGDGDGEDDAGEEAVRPDLRSVEPASAAPPAPARRPVFGPVARTVTLTLAELAAKVGLTTTELRELERQGILVPTPFGDDQVYDDEALAVATLAGRFKAIGLDARHLRMYKLAAEREAGVYEQLVVPLRKRDADGAREAVDLLEELAAMGEEMRAAMLRQALRAHLP